MEYHLLELSCFTAFYTTSGLASFKLAPRPPFTKIENKKEYYLYYQEMISILHAIVALIFGTYVILKDGIAVNQANTYLHYLYIANSLSYFLYDTINSEILKTSDTMMRLHHVCSIIGVAGGFLSNYGGTETTVAIFLAEISNPCILMRSTLRRLNKTESTFYSINEVIFAINFVTARSFIAPIYAMMVYSADNCPYITKISSSMMLFISSFWVIQVQGILWKKIGQLMGPGDKPFWWNTINKFYVEVRKDTVARCAVFGTIFMIFIVAPNYYVIMMKKAGISLF